MKKFLLMGIICLCGILVGCSNNHDMTDSNDDLSIQNSISAGAAAGQSDDACYSHE